MTDRTDLTNRAASNASEFVDVQLNGRPQSVPAGLSVRALLESLSLQPEMIVVERNFEILDKAAYGRVQVVEGDRFELVHFVGGG